MWANFLNIVQELACFILVRGYEFVKSIFHQGYRDGRKKLPPLKHKFLQFPATKLALMIRNGELSSETLVRAVIERILQVDPLINAVVDQRFESAIKEAQAVDKTIKSTGEEAKVQLFAEKPVLGVPITVKDSVGVTGLLAEVGNEERAGIRADNDAVVVQRLRGAGAIILATTNVPEMCLWIESSNHLHGRTNNPFDLHRTSGGSSGGEGALVSACGSVWGVGSDIAGSIRLPSAWCGLFGHKPTPLTISRDGLIPEDPRGEKRKIGVMGPMARSADDLIAMYKILANNCAELKLDEKVEVPKLKFYFCDNEGSTFVSCIDPKVRLQVHRVVEFLRSELSAEVKPLPEPEQLKKAGQYWFSYARVNNFGQLKKAFTAGADWQPWAELLKHAVGYSKRSIYALILSIIDDIRGTDVDAYRAVYQEYEEYKKRIHELLSDNGVLILPSSLSAAPFHHGTLCHPSGYFGFAGLINVLKLPSTVVPMGLSPQGIPLSVQIVAGPLNDRLTLAVAKLLETRFGGYIPPFSDTNE